MSDLFDGKEITHYVKFGESYHQPGLILYWRRPRQITKFKMTHYPASITVDLPLTGDVYLAERWRDFSPECGH